MALLALVPVGLLFTYVLGPRFYILYLPFLCMWAVVGIFAFSEWAKQSAAMCGLAQAHLPKIATAAQILAALSILLPAAAFAAWRLRDAQTEWPFREAIASLAATETAPMRMADTSTQAAFHANADFIWLPYSDEATALRYLAKTGVTHVVLRDDVGERPYLKKWIDEGVPGASRLVDVTSSKGVRFQVYQLGR
jgi:hypothetical protein